jgi:hypothetical protein
MFAGPPKIHAWGRAGSGSPVGVDEGAVEVDVRVSGQLRGHGLRPARTPTQPRPPTIRRDSVPGPPAGRGRDDPFINHSSATRSGDRRHDAMHRATECSSTQASLAPSVYLAAADRAARPRCNTSRHLHVLRMPESNGDRNRRACRRTLTYSAPAPASNRGNNQTTRMAPAHSIWWHTIDHWPKIESAQLHQTDRTLQTHHPEPFG